MKLIFLFVFGTIVLVIYSYIRIILPVSVKYTKLLNFFFIHSSAVTFDRQCTGNTYNNITRKSQN